jgi:alkanesulfonate monooxygenase SsuD/methylene tetrahydromethanopterin reductase-like flavin-dependent oxidoreductase (luciferase family)
VTLHLGITPWHLNPPTAASIGDQAAFAEANGYQSFWLPENHFGDGALPDPLMLLASAATSTSSIQLATTSYLLTLRNPLQAAEQVAVLDQLSGGRVLLGVGRGYAPEMLRAFHVPVAEKRRIFAWTLDLMQKAWSGEAISLDGDPEHAVMVHPRPVQQATSRQFGWRPLGLRLWPKPVAWGCLIFHLLWKALKLWQITTPNTVRRR